MKRFQAYHAYMPFWYRTGYWGVLLLFMLAEVVLAWLKIHNGEQNDAVYNYITVIVPHCSLMLCGIADNNVFPAFYRKDNRDAELLKTSPKGDRLLCRSVQEDFMMRLLFCYIVCGICPLPGRYLLLSGGDKTLLLSGLFGMQTVLMTLGQFMSMNLLTLITRFTDTELLLVLEIYLSALFLVPADLLVLLADEISLLRRMRPVGAVIFLLINAALILMHLRLVRQSVDVRWYEDNVNEYKTEREALL